MQHKHHLSDVIPAIHQTLVFYITIIHEPIFNLCIFLRFFSHNFHQTLGVHFLYCSFSFPTLHFCITFD
ncbi:hypothetical protein QVD17_18035 [Tagetes erecta]|uniref:Uncharacterized protein n=1 Tax=Tagetes erecta TaxID=13708 RepID=A0AAD8NVV7_TARER|nr:hypothetical protein QVD17_18035 [Tagetes erecta]